MSPGRCVSNCCNVSFSLEISLTFSRPPVLSSAEKYYPLRYDASLFSPPDQPNQTAQRQQLDVRELPRRSSITVLFSSIFKLQLKLLSCTRTPPLSNPETHIRHLTPALFQHIIHPSPLAPPIPRSAGTVAAHSASTEQEMGFPVGYSDLYVPKTLVCFLTILGFISKLVRASFSLLGFGDFPELHAPQYASLADPATEPRSVSAALIREFLPVARFSDLAEMEQPESCAVCLYEFAGDDEIRRLRNCRHVFHRSCVDRWMDHDQKTCPLCRTHFIPEDMQEAFNERLWAASGVWDLYGENSATPAGL
ncbi:hypothetical protein F511_07402 [Dorcoceras hygrometricum]|uniref:RING-type domain-containing protein n=1 Tax=Dorcoceras hygrometricum TaxID=472368 RepID=A0A2Z7BHU4_9LAMI|nr:hypothetical protein F511_07402 [Dorcoceras hygrometricum]